MRAIAAAAHVDPALVIRHYRSKELLFLETMQISEEDALLFDGPLDQLGIRLADYVIRSDQRVRGVFVALQRASDSGGVGSRLRTMHDEGVVQPLLTRLEGDDAELRARLVAAMMGGLMYALWTVGDKHLSAADPTEVAAAYGAAMQRLITPSAP